MRNKIYRNPNIMHDHYDSEVMTTFMKQYQHLYMNADSWEEYGPFKVLIEMENGDMYMYDLSERRVRRIRLINNSIELTEGEWRRGFAYFLKEAIYESHLTQYELAEDIQISSVMLSRYLTCKATPSCYIVQRIADALDCDIQDILPHDFIPLR